MRVAYCTVDPECVPGIVDFRRRPLSVDRLFQERAIVVDDAILDPHPLKKGSCFDHVSDTRPIYLMCFRF